jgi:hypothetical protein
MRLVIIYLCCSLIAEAQQTSLGIQTGVSLITIHNIERRQLSPNSTFCETFGIVAQKHLDHKYAIILGLTYSPRKIIDYTSKVYDFQLQQQLTITTNSIQHEIQLPFFMIRKVKNFEFGAGVIFTYLANAVTSSTSNGGAANRVGKYDFQDRVTTAPY